MEQINLLKQMIHSNKTIFDNTISGLEMVREQNEKMINAFLEHAPGIPMEGRNAIDEFLKACRNGSDDFKKMVDEAYGKVERFMNASK